MTEKKERSPGSIKKILPYLFIIPIVGSIGVVLTALSAYGDSITSGRKEFTRAQRTPVQATQYSPYEVDITSQEGGRLTSENPDVQRMLLEIGVICGYKERVPKMEARGIPNYRIRVTTDIPACVYAMNRFRLMMVDIGNSGQ